MRCLTLFIAMFSTSLSAHELWVEPTDYQISADTSLTANVVNGEEFDGTRLPYLPQRFARFVVVSDGKVANVTGRIGDVPAMAQAPLGDGLHIAAYVSTPATLNYKTWEKFQKFVDHKDLGDVRPQHDARGLPDGDFDEVYTRFSKSLFGVGDAAGSDRRLGLETELVALTNPYQGAFSQMQLQLFYQQSVRANEQIELFEKAPNGTVTITLHRTDGDGIATLPVKAGHEYMADAVVLREPAGQLAADTGAAWETLWANLTWKMP